MSYMVTRDLLQRLLEQHTQFISWARFQAEGMQDDVLHVLAARVVEDAIVRRDAVRDALERSDAKALATELQYEDQRAPDEAIKALPKTIVRDADELIGAVAGFWNAVIDELSLLAREATNSGAEGLFKRLAAETESTISSEAWAARPE